MPATVNFNAPGSSRVAKARRLIRLSDGDMTVDGDTMAIEQPIRMVSCDTPEKGHYAGNPPVSQRKLEKCLERLGNGFYDALPVALRDYLGGKLTNEKRSNAENLTGTGIDGGQSRHVAKGDFIMVPEGTPHWFSKIDGTVVLMSLHLPHKAAK